MYAIVNVNGCQHKVETGKFFKSEKINASASEIIHLSFSPEAVKYSNTKIESFSFVISNHHTV